jgi:hypothetical protein
MHTIHISFFIHVLVKSAGTFVHEKNGEREKDSARSVSLGWSASDRLAAQHAAHNNK